GADGADARHLLEQFADAARIVAGLGAQLAQVSVPPVENELRAPAQCGRGALVVALVVCAPEGVHALLPAGLQHLRGRAVTRREQLARGVHRDVGADADRGQDDDEELVERPRRVAQPDPGLVREGLAVLFKQVTDPVAQIVGRGHRFLRGSGVRIPRSGTRLRPTCTEEGATVSEETGTQRADDTAPANDEGLPQLEDAATPEATHSADEQIRGEWQRAGEMQQESDHLREVLDDARQAVQKASDADSMESGGI